MQALKNLGLIDVLHKVTKHKIPLLGICLGMQLLFDESDEFELTQGLGLISGKVTSLPKKTTIGEMQKIPSIGWRSLQKCNEIEWDGTLLKNINPGESLYFVHSFMAAPLSAKNCIAEYVYGGHKIVAMVQNDNIVGCQFHPEKSGEAGLKVLRQFCAD